MLPKLAIAREISRHFHFPFRVGMEIWKNAAGLEALMERRVFLDTEKNTETEWYGIILVSDGFSWSGLFLLPYTTRTLIYNTHIWTPA